MGVFENPSDWMLCAGIALLCAVGLRKWYRQYGGPARRKRARRELKASSQTKSSAQGKGSGKSRSQRLLDAPTDVVRWQVEMHELARDLKAEIDTKITVLQQVTLRAHHESERLEQLLHQLEEKTSARTP